VGLSFRNANHEVTVKGRLSSNSEIGPIAHGDQTTTTNHPRSGPEHRNQAGAGERVGLVTGAS
jgi:hypothetical protein